MKLRFSVVCLFIFFGARCFSQTVAIDSAFLDHAAKVEITSDDFNKLLPDITAPGNTTEQKLTLVYYWVFKHLSFDTKRFMISGPLQPLSTEETLKSGKGLCYEYNQLFSIACNYLKVPGFDIEGYVKYYGFTAGGTFTQNNHIWHAVYLDGKWRMTDLLWASGTLAINGNNYKFNKSLQKEFFLVSPESFLKTHLPADPVWQFQDKPLALAGFTAKEFTIDNDIRGVYINYADSIKIMSKLSAVDRDVRSGLRAYSFNPKNVDQLIIIYYNSAVSLFNNEKASKTELIKARKYFSQSIVFISKTTNKDLQALAPVCGRGVIAVTTRLNKYKT